jgi:hypothetical protein
MRDGWIPNLRERKVSLIWPHSIEKGIFTIMPFIRKGYFYAKKNPFCLTLLLIVSDLPLATPFTYDCFEPGRKLMGFPILDRLASDTLTNDWMG